MKIISIILFLLKKKGRDFLIKNSKTKRREKKEKRRGQKGQILPQNKESVL